MDFDDATKETLAVFLKRKVDGKFKYTREPYNLVTYNQHKTNAFSGVEGVKDAGLQQMTQNSAVSDPVEEYDGIYITEVPPFNGVTRFGQK